VRPARTSGSAQQRPGALQSQLRGDCASQADQRPPPPQSERRFADAHSRSRASGPILTLAIVLPSSRAGRRLGRTRRAAERNGFGSRAGFACRQSEATINKREAPEPVGDGGKPGASVQTEQSHIYRNLRSPHAEAALILNFLHLQSLHSNHLDYPTPSCGTTCDGCAAEASAIIGAAAARAPYRSDGPAGKVAVRPTSGPSPP
jgi:hypothetical protein